METIALRLVLPPLIITAATLAQRRLGDRLGGLVVGLPLTSGTFLGIVLLTHGRAAVSHAATGMLAGQIALIALTVGYSRLAQRAGVLTALLGAVALWGLTVTVVRPLDGVWATGAVYLAVAGAALLTWPQSVVAQASSPPSSSGYGWMGARVALGSALVIALTAGIGILGPQLAGTLSAAPLIALVLTPSTHRTSGAHSVRELLAGVTHGSVGAAAFAVVVCATARSLGGLAIILAALACLTTVTLVGRSLPRR